jgi:hypothetical protein
MARVRGRGDGVRPRARQCIAVTDREQAADQLQAVALEDFVAERKRLARELRGSGDREGAAELSKLAKPTPPAWALNAFAREQPDVIATWLDAATALRAASEDPGEGLREAMRLHRDATRGLLAAIRGGARPNGRELSEPMVERVRDLLAQATADPDAAERLRAGRVVEADAADAPAGDGAAKRGTGKDAPKRRGSPQRAAKRGVAKAGAKSGGPGTAAERRSEERARRAEERERAAADRRAREREELEGLVADAEERSTTLRAEAGERAAAAEQAGERLAQARRDLKRSESEAEAAASAAKDAADAARQAEREHRKLASKLRAAS